MTSKTSGIVLLIAGMAMFGSATPISKIVGEDFPVFTASLMRVVLGALVLLPFVARDLPQSLQRIRRQDWLYLSLIALFGMVGFTVLLLYGMRLISGVAGSVVMSFTPALTAVGAWLFMRAPMGWQRAAALALGLLGLLLMSLFKEQFGAGKAADGLAFYGGAALVLGAIACEAAYTLLGKKVTDDVPPLLTSFLAAAMSVPLFAVFAWFDIGGFQPGEVPAASWAALAWWGAATLGAGSALWYSGIARAEGTTAAGFMAVMPLSALFLSYFLLGEDFHWLHLPGIALVLASVALMSRVHAKM